MERGWIRWIDLKVTEDFDVNNETIWAMRPTVSDYGKEKNFGILESMNDKNISLTIAVILNFNFQQNCYHCENLTV